MKKYRKCKFLEIVPNDNCVEFDESECRFPNQLEQIEKILETCID